MAVIVDHTPLTATFRGTTNELAPVATLLRNEGVSFTETEDGLTIDLREQGENSTSKSVFVLDLVDFYSGQEESI
jgi:hypothetical protein